MATYRITLTDRKGNRYGLLNAASGSSGLLSYSTVLNGGGQWQVNPWLELPLISGKQKRQRLRAWASEVIIERLDGPGLHGVVMAGPVTKPKADIDNDTLTVTGLPVFGWLGERQITQPEAYADVDQLVIPTKLIAKYASSAGIYGPAGDIRLTVPTQSTGIFVSQQYQPTDQKTVATAITDLSAADNGFDFDVILQKTRGDVVTRIFQAFSPTKGSKVSSPLTPGAGGLRGFTLEDATDIATRVTGTGQLTITQQVDAALEDLYGVHTQSMALADETTIDLLKRQVAQYLAVRAPGTQIATFGYQVSERTPYGFHRDGDQIRVIAGRGWADFDDYVRVIGSNVAVDPEGNEMVTCVAATPDGLS